MAPSSARQLAIAITAGVISMGTFAFIATLFQAPGLDAPVEVARISVIAAVLGVVALPLLWWDNRVGYALAVIDGAVVVLGIVLYTVGAFGPTRSAPAAYLFLLLGAILIVAAGFAWRDRGDPDAGPTGRSTV